MAQLRKLISSFSSDDRGATAIEYALIAAIICIGIVASLTLLRGELNSSLTRTSNAFPK
jgi:pilus assembly protein Flp/PilA